MKPALRTNYFFALVQKQAAGRAIQRIKNGKQISEHRCKITEKIPETVVRKIYREGRQKQQ